MVARSLRIARRAKEQDGSVLPEGERVAVRWRMDGLGTDRAALARIVKRVGRPRAAAAIGYSPQGIDYALRAKKRPLREEQIQALLELDAVPPITPVEVRRIVEHLGGARRVAPLVGVRTATLRHWMQGKTQVPYARIGSLRALGQRPAWEPCVEAHRPGTGRLSREGRGLVAPMAHEEFLEFVTAFGSIPAMARIMSCGVTTLYRYARAETEVAPALAAALCLARAEGRIAPRPRTPVELAYRKGGNRELAPRRFSANRTTRQSLEEVVFVALRKRGGPVRAADLGVEHGLSASWTAELLRRLARQGKVTRLLCGGQRWWMAEPSAVGSRVHRVRLEPRAPVPATLVLANDDIATVDIATVRRIVKRIGRPVAARAMGYSVQGFDHILCSETMLARPFVQPLLDLDAVVPMSADEVRRIVKRLGGIHRTAPFLGVAPSTLWRWHAGMAPVPYAQILPLRSLWHQPAYQPERGSPPIEPHHPGRHRISKEGRGRCMPMAVDEFLDYVAEFGGIAPMAKALGGSRVALYGYASGANEVAPTIAAALRHWKNTGRIDPAARLPREVAYRPGGNRALVSLRLKQLRMGNGAHGVSRPGREILRDLLHSRSRPFSIAEIMAATGFSKAWTRRLLKQLLKAGEVQRLGGHRPAHFTVFEALASQERQQSGEHGEI